MAGREEPQIGGRNLEAVEGSLKKFVALICLALQIVLLPAAVYLAMQLPIESLAPKFRGKALRFAILVIWPLLAGFACSPFILMAALPDAFRVVLGPARYRRKWMKLQFFAWAGMLATWAVMTALIVQFGNNKSLSDALAFSSLGAVAMGIGYYLLAMSRMPSDFFDEDNMGQRVLGFLGCSTSDGVNQKCVIASIVLGLIGLALVATPLFVFTGPS